MGSRELALLRRGNNNSMTMSKPSAVLNSIFMTTVDTAAKTLVAVASKTEQLSAADHARFVFMMMTWFAVWALRTLMDHLPCSLLGGPSQPYDKLLLQGLSSNFLYSSGGSFEFPPLPSFALTPSTSTELVLYDAGDGHSAQGLGRALVHVFALLNEIPATSRKYQFAVAMADKMVDENARSGQVELHEINRSALSAAFARTLSFLHRSLKEKQAPLTGRSGGTWASRVLGLIPLSSYVTPYLRGMRTVYSLVRGEMVISSKEERQRGEDVGDVTAEKYAQELLWITNKLRMCGAVDEAVMQWSLASGVASLSLTANPRVQGSIVKISSILFMELARGNFEVSSNVKYRLLVLWLPLFCYADNGLAYPVLTGYEKIEIERAIDEVIMTLPSADQEVVLTNWLQDFVVTASDWPNLQSSYDRWCQSKRMFVNESVSEDPYAFL